MKSYSEIEFFVLFVDDEESITKLLHKIFYKKYNVLIANSVDRAIELIEKNKVSVAIVDHDMPGKNGMELLRYLKKKQPSVQRVMLTGSTDPSIIRNAINEGEVANFIEKPLEKAKIDSIIEINFDRFLENRKKKLIDKSLESDAQAYRIFLSLQKKNEDSLKMIEDTQLSFDKIRKICQSQYRALKNNYLIMSTKKKFVELYESIDNSLNDALLITTEFRISDYEIVFRMFAIHMNMVNNNTARANYHISKVRVLLSRNLTYPFLEEHRILVESFDDMRSYSNKSDEESFKEAYNLIYPLLNINTKSLGVDNTKQIYDKKQLGYILVLKHELPVFTYEFSPRVNINPELISNFIVALKIFADDVFTSDGHLKTITHELGTIIIHNESEEVFYVISADIETALIKFKLRKFASETIGFFDKLESFKKVNSNNNFLLEKIKNIFIH